MGIKEKQTYGEYYWAMQVEAQKLFADDIEAEVSSYVSSMFKDLKIREVLPASFGKYVDAMTSKKSFAWGGILARFGSEMADSVLSQTMGAALKDFNYLMSESFGDERIRPEQANILYQRKNIGDTFWAARMLSGGYRLSEAIHAYGASLPYPTIPDIMTFARYAGDGSPNKSLVWSLFDVPADEYDLWNFQTLQRLTSEQAHTLLRRGIISDGSYHAELRKIGWGSSDINNLSESGWSIPNAMLLVQGNLHQRQAKDKIIRDISYADINPKYAKTYLDAILTKPSSQDLVAYYLRKDPELSGLPEALERIGIHEDYTDIYKTLAYPIPPVADIITMAVREAFSPSIAEKFGQYQDYPPEFEYWAKQKGLTADWSRRYWAAHWSLPSANQGFEMLHRGVINESELNLLLRALDIMPFWRDKLVRIAYRRLSRVDIRRMYRVGVMTDSEVYDAYLELGYNERDAKRMSQFTIKQVLATQSKFTTTDIVSAFTKYMITRSEAGTLLTDIGVRLENVSFILTTAEYKRDWKLTDERIAAIHNLYRKGVYTADMARSKLLGLDMPSIRVDVLMSKWYIDEADKPPRSWTTAQTLSFIKDGLITKERGIAELIGLGYDTEHINVYMESLT